MVTPSSTPALSRTQTILAWSLQALLAAAFLASGGSKLMGVQQMVEAFDRIGLGQGFRYVTGLIEVTSGILLLVPGFAAFGAGLLVCTMIGAIVTHLFVIGGSPLPAIVLLVLAAIVLWLRRGDITRLTRR